MRSEKTLGDVEGDGNNDDPLGLGYANFNALQPPTTSSRTRGALDLNMKADTKLASTALSRPQSADLPLQRTDSGKIIDRSLTNGSALHRRQDSSSGPPTLANLPGVAALASEETFRAASPKRGTLHTHYSTGSISRKPSSKSTPVASRGSPLSKHSTSTNLDGSGIKRQQHLSRRASASGSRSFHSQYIRNEKRYLEKIRTNVVDEYYSRHLGPPSFHGSEDGFDETDCDVGETSDYGYHYTDTNQWSSPGSYDGTEDLNIGSSPYINYDLESPLDRNSPEQIVKISSQFLQQRLKWFGYKPKEFKRDELTEYGDLLAVGEPRVPTNQLLQNSQVIKRLEWQTVLQSVLNGDILKSEKTKIVEKVRTPAFTTQYSDQLWLELKAWIYGQTVEEHKVILKILRDSADDIIKNVLAFRLDDDCPYDARFGKIKEILNSYFKILNFWSNLKSLQRDKPVCGTPEFQNRIQAMIGIITFEENFTIKIDYLKNWVVKIKQTDENLGLLDLCVRKDFNRCCSLFAEQMIMERDIESVFRKKIFLPLSPWISKSKDFYLMYRSTLKELNIRFPNDKLSILLMFPVKVIKEIIVLRLKYAKKIANPTMMVIDQMLEDFTQYIRLSLQIKHTLKTYREDWPFHLEFDTQFDTTVVDALKYLFFLLRLKLLGGTSSSVKNFKRPELLFKHWEILKNVGHFIDGSSKVIAHEFTSLSLRLLRKLNGYMQEQQMSPPNFDHPSDGERWLIRLFETLGSNKRKLNRFTNLLASSFQDLAEFNVQNQLKLLEKLKRAGHFLLYTGGQLEQNGIYLFGNSKLLSCGDEEVKRILYNSDCGCEMNPKLFVESSLSLYNVQGGRIVPEGYTSDSSKELVDRSYLDMDAKNRNVLEDTENDTRNYSQSKIFADNGHRRDYYDGWQEPIDGHGYLLAFCPSEPMLWEGMTYNMSHDTILAPEKINLGLTPGKIALMSEKSNHALQFIQRQFDELAGDTVDFLEVRCSFSKVENNIRKSNKAYFICTYNVLKNNQKIVDTFKNISSSNDYLNAIFLFAKDFGLNYLRTNTATIKEKSIIKLLLMRLSITWLTFLSEDSDHTDPRTFRWCVTAMEFSMYVTSGWNILALGEDQFTSLKQRISECMSLLISHFDVMGARSNEIEKINNQAKPNLDIVNFYDIDSILDTNSELRLKNIRHLEEKMRKNPHITGKVLDDTDQDNKYILSLASSLSNVSIRWQKRNFIGGGSFGKVYSAVDLDNGEILAVKVIKLQNMKSMEAMFPLLKEEMRVLEVLNHPNIIQYFGVEVHRDKINIFMEYCEGGSLANLLEHGRIEDEMVTQVYTLELLEGLAYLHESGIVHRDIKPENILIDMNGIIKYVDFGAARMIAKRSTISDASTDCNDKIDNDMSSGKSLIDLIGTPMYMAPETITGSKVNLRFGADDVWSLGCVVLEMMTGRRPWSQLDNEWAIMYHVAAGQVPPLPSKDEASDAGKHFLESCLVQDPMKRATAVELLMDSWIVDIRDMVFANDSMESSTISEGP